MIRWADIDIDDRTIADRTAVSGTMDDCRKHMTIKDMSAAERPREKLLERGAEALTVPELLAIIIGGGTRKQTAVELMQNIMSDCEDSLVNLNRMTVDDLMQYSGIGEARALSIVAAAEIGRRRLGESVSDRKPFSDSSIVYEYIQSRMQDKDYEQSWVLLLNNSMRLIRCVELSSGGLTETAVDVRQILKYALLAGATCFILIHNHPSGSARPSRTDEELTQRVKRGGEAVNIRMMDHVIVTDGDYYSFAENGKL